MEWLAANWALLLGAGGASIPIILHLIYRRRAPRVIFSTLRFIRLSAERTRRRRRIQEWLLLLLRVLAILLLGLALRDFAMPFFKGTGGGDVAAAVVVDNSYSLAAEFEGDRLFWRAREAGTDVLRAPGRAHRRDAGAARQALSGSCPGARLARVAAIRSHAVRFNPLISHVREARNRFPLSSDMF